MQLGEPDASGRRRPEPAPGTEFIDPVRPRPAGHRPGPGARLDRPGSEGPRPRSSAGSRPTRSRSRPAGPASSGPATCASAPRPSSRPSPRAAARPTPSTPSSRASTSTAIRTRQTLAEPQPEFLSIVPFTSEVKEPRYRMTAHGGRGAQPQLHRVRAAVHAARTPSPSRRAASSAPARRSASATCAASGIEYGTTLKTLEPQYHQGAGYRSVTENRFTGINHDYIRDDSHAFILREPSRCIDCGRCAQVCSEVVGAACYDFMRIGFDTLVTTPLDMSLNDTPCVSCGRCAETCPTGALMPKPRVLQKYEVDESRCILCGICVDACPYDALRDGADIELAHTEPRRADDRPDGDRRDRPRDRGHLHPPRARLGRGRRGRGPAGSTRRGCCRSCRPRSPGSPSNGNGHGHGHGHDHVERPRRRDGAARPAGTSSRPCSGSSSRSSSR